MAMLIIMMPMTTFEVSDPVIIRKYLHGNNENDDGDNDDLEWWGKFDDDNNLCGDATIIRDYWLN